MNVVTAFAPATVANVSCGFDILGFAINDLGDHVSANYSEDEGIHISKIDGDGGKLPLSSELNVCTVAVNSMLQEIGRKENISIFLKKGLPLGSGLGSSAASAVAALVAVNTLIGKPFSKKELLPFAMEGEKIACGTAHADNVAPCLLGGFTLIRDYESLDVISLPIPKGIYVTIIHPHFELKTSDSRKVLKKSVSLKDSRIQSGNLAGFITALFREDLELIKRCLIDVIAEPSRALLLPGFYELRNDLLDIGALGSGISGSGPAIFILSPSLKIAEESGTVASKLYTNLGLEIDIYVSSINIEGARVIN